MMIINPFVGLIFYLANKFAPTVIIINPFVGATSVACLLIFYPANKFAPTMMIINPFVGATSVACLQYTLITPYYVTFHY